MKIGVLSETCPNETRVALTPANAKVLVARNLEVIVQAGAGIKSGHADQDYLNEGVVIGNREQIQKESDILLQVQSFGANTVNGDDDLASLRQGQIVVGMMDPLASPKTQLTLAEKQVTSFALEMIPRISRAQSMDVLSSMATLAGYKAVLEAAVQSGRIFPMLMTAAGTLSASKVLIMGAGVAGLQAAATAKRLGGVVSAYDVREAAREQILSVGAKVVELDLETSEGEGAGGYAKEQSAEFLQKQREAMTKVVAAHDIVITTAAVPGAKSPILVTEDMVKAMKPGAVIVDLAAERGGNCELTEQGKIVTAHDVIIIGPENLAASIPHHASQLYGKNIENFLCHLVTKDGELNMDFDDEIIRDTVCAHEGSVVSKRLRSILKLDDESGNKLTANG